MTGRGPFSHHETLVEQFEAILSSRYSFHEPEENHVTPLARDFISKLLVKEPSQRMTVTEALNHEWIKSTNKSTNPINIIIPKYEHFVEITKFVRSSQAMRVGLLN
jgi:serine/threonine protein kinase